MRRPHPAGFTLVELLVALAIGALLLTGMLTGLFEAHRSWEVSRSEMRSIRNERAGVQMMIRDVRMAGSGFGGVSLATPGVPQGVVYPLQPKPGVLGAPDTLVVAAAFDGVETSLTQRLAAPGDAMLVADATGFQVGDLVAVVDDIEGSLFQVTQIANGALFFDASSPYNTPSGHVPWPTNGYEVGSTVARIQRVSYWLDNDTFPPRLFRQQVGGNVLPVALGATDLRIEYILADGTVTPSPQDPAEIRSVRLRYLPEPPHNPRVYTQSPDDTLLVRIQPRVLG